MPELVEKIPESPLPEVVFGTSEKKASLAISKLVKLGRLRPLLPKVYTSNYTDDDASVVRRNLWIILGKLYPGAVLSHRTALEFKPTESGHVFVTHTYTKKLVYPGVTVRFLKGPKAHHLDTPFVGGLFASSDARAFLENMQPSRGAAAQSKTWSIEMIEERLEQIARTKGEDALNELRDKARMVAEELNMQQEFERLNARISAMLTTSPTRILRSSLAQARAFGMPYDPARLERFNQLHRALKLTAALPELADKNTSSSSFRHFAFFEAYFSNYIEGTKFGLEEAKQIIDSQTPLATRDGDSHDILGTFEIVGNRHSASQRPQDADDFLSLLKERHALIMRARVDKRPGEFKTINNFAGETEFVDRSLVRGTLMQSYELYRSLEHPFARAAFMMFVVSEVHPFLDGNGRLARIAMNAELVNTGQTKIIIPTVYRDDYLGALRKLTRRGDADTYIRMLQRAQLFSASIVSENFEEMHQQFKESNAFIEADEARLKIIER